MECFVMEKGHEEPLGKCYDPWDCFNYSFTIRTDSGGDEYKIEADCCQCYFWCQCPCEMCNKVEFKIMDGSTGESVGTLMRTGRDCMKNALLGDDADEFTVDFPENSTWKQRAMLMNMVVFIDYTMFEDTSNQKNQQGANY